MSPPSRRVQTRDVYVKQSRCNDLEFKIDAKRLARASSKTSFFRRESSNFFLLSFLPTFFPPPLVFPLFFLLAYVVPSFFLFFLYFTFIRRLVFQKDRPRPEVTVKDTVEIVRAKCSRPVRSPHKSFPFEIRKWAVLGSHLPLQP